MEIASLEHDNFEIYNSEKRSILKRRSENDKSDKEQSEKGQFPK